MELVTIIAFLYYLKTKNLLNLREQKKINVLALNYNRFSDVLEIIEKNSNFKILTLPFSWQSRFLNFFYDNNDKKNIGMKIGNKNNKLKYYNFLKLFLRKYYRFTKVKLVLGTAIHYKQDIDWGNVSKLIGVPYIVLHKENLYATQKHIENVKNKLAKRKKFEGSHVIVHNEIVKKAWVESKFIDSLDISVCGKLIKNQINVPNRKVNYDLVFFSFGPGTGLGSVNGIDVFPSEKSIGFHKLCRQTHLAIIEFAIKNPQKKVLIKPKWGGKWIDYIIKLANEKNININDIKNLTIDEQINSFNVIENCLVVISFNSTTILEAAIKNKFVIIPFFHEAKTNLEEYVFFRKYFSIFEVAESSRNLYEKIKLGFKNPRDHQKFLLKRKKLYELFISSIKDDTVRKYIHVLNRQMKIKKI